MGRLSLIGHQQARADRPGCLVWRFYLSFANILPKPVEGGEDKGVAGWLPRLPAAQSGEWRGNMVSIRKQLSLFTFAFVCLAVCLGPRWSGCPVCKHGVFANPFVNACVCVRCCEGPSYDRERGARLSKAAVDAVGAHAARF